MDNLIQCEVEIGDFVQFIAGGPTMLVANVFTDVYDYELEMKVDKVRCRWFDTYGVFHEREFWTGEICYAKHPE